MANGKVIVVSDIHMSNGASYSWFQGRYVADVRTMFEHFAAASGIAELVLLGDILDLWLYPVSVQPWTASQIIANLDAGILSALRNCVAHVPNAYYFTGNHDMNVTPSDIALLTPGNKQLSWITPQDYNAGHLNQWHLEHGLAADMFNAPDDATDTIGGYPLGFFITRLAASGPDQGAVYSAVRHVIDIAAGAHQAGAISDGMGKVIVEAIVTALKLASGVAGNTPIRFSEPNLDNQYTVDDIMAHYWSLYDTWVAKYPSYLVQTMLAGLTDNGLDWYAKLLLQAKTAPIAVMGHTHYAEQNPAGANGYDNSGCWCHPSIFSSAAPQPTYVEIADGKATVKKWGSS